MLNFVCLRYINKINNSICFLFSGHAVGKSFKKQHKRKTNTCINTYFSGQTTESEDEHFPDMHPGSLRLAGWLLGLSHGTQAPSGFLRADSSHSRAQASFPADPSQYGEPFHTVLAGIVVYFLQRASWADLLCNKLCMQKFSRKRAGLQNN